MSDNKIRLITFEEYNNKVGNDKCTKYNNVPFNNSVNDDIVIEFPCMYYSLKDIVFYKLDITEKVNYLLLPKKFDSDGILDLIKNSDLSLDNWEIYKSEKHRVYTKNEMFREPSMYLYDSYIPEGSYLLKNTLTEESIEFSLVLSKYSHWENSLVLVIPDKTDLDNINYFNIEVKSCLIKTIINEYRRNNKRVDILC